MLLSWCLEDRLCAGSAGTVGGKICSVPLIAMVAEGSGGNWRRTLRIASLIWCGPHG